MEACIAATSSPPKQPSTTDVSVSVVRRKLCFAQHNCTSGPTHTFAQRSRQQGKSSSMDFRCIDLSQPTGSEAIFAAYLTYLTV